MLSSVAHQQTPSRSGSGAASRWSQVLVPRFPTFSRGASFDIGVSVLIAVAVLILALTHQWSHALVGGAQFGDAAYWDLGAESWARGYVATKNPDIRPGYSLFMGIIYSVFGVDANRALAAQAVLYAASAVMLYSMGRHLGGRLIGLVAAVQYTLNPYMWEWAAITTTDLLGGFANLAALLFLVDALRGRGRLVSAALFGVFFAIANIIRIFTLPFIGPALLLLLLVRGSLWRRATVTAVALVATILALIPGLLYQYYFTGDFGLSSNSASAIYAASSPKYRIWTPEIYPDATVRLEASGVPATPANVEAEFRRMALENYIAYPWFQLERLWGGFWGYTAFEGQSERPDRYVFYRPYVLAVPLVAVILAGLAGSLPVVRRWVAGQTPTRLRWWALVPLAAAVGGLLYAPLPTLLTAQALGAFGAVVAMVWKRGERQRGAFAVAAFWSATGLFAVLSTGITGFLLHRLSVQVEPSRTLLFALAVAYLIWLLIPDRLARARLLQLHAIVRWTPRFPGVVRLGLRAVAAAFVLLFLVGGVRLAAANVFPPDDGGPFPAPAPAELAALARQLDVPEPITYLDATTFPAQRATLQLPTSPEKIVAWALPGQFTRFVWQVEHQERSLYWYVFADRPRPVALDLTLLMGEAGGYLRAADLRDRPGLLIVAPTGPYFDASGDPSQFSLIPARAFVPWDSRTRRFQPEAAIVFPVNTQLYGHQRFEAATRVGKIDERGPLRVVVGDRNIPTLMFETTAPADDGGRQAALTYRDLWIQPGSQFQLWSSLHPVLFNRADAGQPRLQVLVRAGGREVVVGERVFDPMRTDERVYLPFQVDLSAYQGQRVDLTMRVLADATATATEPAVVMVGLPRIYTP